MHLIEAEPPAWLSGLRAGGGSGELTWMFLRATLGLFELSRGGDGSFSTYLHAEGGVLMAAGAGVSRSYDRNCG